MEREVGGGIGMGNTCKPMAVSFQCMTIFTTNKKKKRKKKKMTQLRRQKKKKRMQHEINLKKERSRGRLILYGWASFSLNKDI